MQIRAFACQARCAGIDCHHNYVARERHYRQNILVTRKGAVRAREGDLGIIPGSMGARSYIVRGKGNRESFTRCSHGRARDVACGSQAALLRPWTTSRCRWVWNAGGAFEVIDETIATVMAAQSDVVEIVHTLRRWFA